MSKKKRLEVSAPQVIGGALAASTAAVAASILGVYGTVIGAAVVSVLASVGGAVYTHSFHKGKQAIEKVRVNRTVRMSRVSGEESGSQESTGDEEPTSSEEQPAAPATAATEAADDGATQQVDGPVAGTPATDRPSWRQRLAGINPNAMAVTAACVLVLSLSTIVFAETLLGKPLSAALSGDDAEGGNSISRAFDEEPGGRPAEVSSSPEPTSSETPSGTPVTTVPATSPDSDEQSTTTSTSRRPMDPTTTTSKPATSSSPVSSVKPTTSAPQGASIGAAAGERMQQSGGE